MTLPSWEEIEKQLNKEPSWEEIQTKLPQLEEITKTPTGSQFGGNWGIPDLIKKEREKEKQKIQELMDIEKRKKQLQATYELFTTQERQKQDLSTKQLFGKKDTGFKLEQAPKKTFFDEAKKIFEAKPAAQLAKAQVSYNISQKTGIPIEEVHKNLDKITKDLGIRGIPTSDEFITAMFVFPVTAALISHPVTTGIGVAKFLALVEAENFAISKLKKWDYKFGEGKGIKELLPEDTSKLIKDVVDVADFIGKGFIIAKTDPKFMKIWKTFTEKISTEYKMPEKVYVSGKKIRSIFQTGEHIGKEESQLITDLGLNASQYKNAMKKGIDIEIPISKITTITDRPYWAKIKGLFNIKSTTKTVISRGGKVAPAKLMIEGKMEIPKVKPVIKPKVEIPITKPEVKPKVEIKPEISVIESYTPYEKMNMLKTGARVNRLKALYNAKGEGVEKVEINGKIESLETVIKRTQEQSNLPELEKAAKAVEPKEELKVEPKIPTTPKDLEAKREMLREHGVKEELLTDEFVKKAKITELPKADVTSETVSKGLIEDLEKKWGKEVKLTKKDVLEKVEKPKVEGKEPELTKEEAKEEVKLFKEEVKEGRLTPEELKVKPKKPTIPAFDDIKRWVTKIDGKLVKDSWVTKGKEFVSLQQPNGETSVIEYNKLKEELKTKPKEPTIPTKKEIPKLPKEEQEFIESGFKDKKDFLERIKPEKIEKTEKLLTPEGTVTGEKGSVYIPTMAEVQNLGTRIGAKLDIQLPFNKAGAPETGFQVKNFYGNIGMAHEQGLGEIETLNKFNFKFPTSKESGFKPSDEIDYTDITYLSERPGYFVKLTPEERARVSPAKRSVKDFYKKWEDKLREIGWLEEPFPKSLITRNNREINDLRLSLPRLKTPEARAKVKGEINKLQDQIDRIKKQKIQFVSVPAKMILAKAGSDPALRQKIMSILPHWGRKTITVQDLVKTGIMTRKEADIRNIIGEYSDRMGRKYALGKIFENAEKEGLIKSQSDKPDWATPRIYIRGQHVSIPQLRGKRLDPFFNDVITDFFSAGEPMLGGVWGVAKMLQFYNPLFLPMYDVWQFAAAGAVLTPKTPKYIAQGIKDVWLKTDNYYRAVENGTMSKPFVIPYDKWEHQFSEAMKGNKMGEFIKKAALPTNWIPMAYVASWHTAWTLDPMVRMMTFNMLQDQGMSDREAGQLAALFHSDYASVPPKTRKALNKLFFTPTFKITMGKLYLGMLKGTAEVLTKGKNATQREKILQRGALIALAMMMGISAYFKSQGYEEVERFRKYVKTVETDEGMKENVITLANPFNIPWRYYYRVKGAFKPQTTNVAEKLLQTVKWDLHPVWRVASDVVSNYNGTVYNPFDSDKKIAFDIALYVTGKIVKVTEGLLESAKEGEIKADVFKALQKDLGTLEAVILKPFIFNYLREVKSVRKHWAINKLQKDFKRLMLVSPSRDPEVNYKRLQNFNQRMKEIIEEFE